MMRTVAFALAAMAATSLDAAPSASAMGHGVGSSSHAVSGHASGIGPSASFHHFAGPGHNFASHHHRHRHRVVFVGAPFGYDDGYDYDACYARVWTKRGWRLVPQCY